MAAIDALGEQFGPRPEYDESKGYDENSAAKRTWTSRVRVGLSEGRLSPQRATALGYEGSNDNDPDNHDEYVLNWKPMPSATYHATTDMRGVLRDGLKTRAELGQHNIGHGLGGGEDGISVSTDPQIAHDIVSGLKVMHSVLSGSTHHDDLLKMAERGDDTGGVGFRDRVEDSMMSSYGKTWRDRLKPGAVEKYRGSGPAGTSPPDREIERGGWKMSHSPGDKVWHKGQWHDDKAFMRPVSEDAQRDIRYSLGQSYLFHREQNGGPSDPMFFNTDTKALLAKDPSNFGVVKVTHAGDAYGYPMRGMKEWRTESGRNLRVERHI